LPPSPPLNPSQTPRHFFRVRWVHTTLRRGLRQPQRSRRAGRTLVVIETGNVYVTGSHIPERVPKSAGVRTPPTISPLTVLTADDMRRALGPSPAPMH